MCKNEVKNRVTMKPEAWKLNRIQKYFAAWRIGCTIALNSDLDEPKMDTHIILAKHELNGAYYFVLQSKQYKVSLARIIYTVDVTLRKVARNSMEYEEHKADFNTWIKEAKEYRSQTNRKMFDEYVTKYKPVAVRRVLYTEEGVKIYKFISKHEYKGNYYFVVKTDEGDYLVVKIAWFGFAKLVRLTEKEQTKDAEVFESWIKEAKSNSKKNKAE